jgi:N-methylhydantoinase A
MSETTFRIGLDTGGTFIDGVAIASDGTVAAAKTMSVAHGDPAAVLGDLSAAWSLRIDEFLGRAQSIVYGTTAGLNALLTRDGATTGLLTTKGHEDALLIGRVHQKVAGLTPLEMSDVAKLSKPSPLVPRNLIKGIRERVDSRGREVVRLDRAQVVESARQLVDAGCESIAVSFLWSFQNDSHEREAREVIYESFADLPVTLSVDTAPVLGEYERTASTAVSAYIRPSLERDILDLQRRLSDLGFGGELYVMQSNGGFATVVEAIASPAVTLGSGPAGGVVAAALPSATTEENVISSDMGGTSFDVGLIVGRSPTVNETPIVGRIHLALPSIEVTSIGAGGGSIAGWDDVGGLKVGPESAGADPGPACFGRGGRRPTVTDADLLLGRLNPKGHPDPRLRLDHRASERVVTELAERVGVDTVEAAIGMVRVADAQMADLIRRVTLQRGHDPREFSLIAYGGAGPLHVGAYAPDVGVSSASIPRLAAAFSARGLAMSTWRKVYRKPYSSRLPVSAGDLHDAFRRLEDEALADFSLTGLSDHLILSRTADLRYGRQTHVLKVPFPEGAVTRAAIDRVVDDFTSDYERTFGAGTGYREAGVELVALGVSAIPSAAHSPDGESAADLSRSELVATSRAVYFDRWVETPEMSLESLPLGTQIDGPAVIDGVGTTLVVHPGQHVTVHPHGLDLTWGDR